MGVQGLRHLGIGAAFWAGVVFSLAWAQAPSPEGSQESGQPMGTPAPLMAGVEALRDSPWARKVLTVPLGIVLYPIGFWMEMPLPEGGQGGENPIALQPAGGSEEGGREFPLQAPSAGGFAPLGRGSLKRRLTISGSGSLVYRDYQVKGNAPTFRFDNPFRQRLTNQASLFINGPLYGDTYISATINRSTYVTTQQRWRLIHEGSDAKVTLGDLDLRFGDNEFVPFNRTLQGLQIETRIGSVTFNAFGSLIRGSVRRESFPGNGTGGPYYLRYRPIVEGSEVVMVDGERMRRGSGETGDYTLDYVSGLLFFNAPRIIPPTSTITVSYETYIAGQQPGELFGLRAAWGLGRLGEMGLTFIGQTAKGGGGPRYRNWTEELLANDSVGPYHLLRTPIKPESEAVFVDGQRQRRGADYLINYQSGVLQFTRPVPSTSRISVTYQYEAPIAEEGDRNILGLDGRFHLLPSSTPQRSLALHLQLASSTPGLSSGTLGYGGPWGWGGSRQEPTAEASGGRGNAFKARLMGRWEALELAAEFKDISPRFSRIDSVGYFQNERGLSLNLAYRPRPDFNAFLRYDRFRRPGLGIGGSSGSALGAQESVGLNWTPRRGPQVQFLHNAYKNAGGGSSYAMVRDSLSFQQRQGFFQWMGSLDYSRNRNQGDAVFGGLRTSTLASRLSLSYSNQRWFDLRADFGSSSTSSASGSTRSQNLNLGLNLTPGSQWSITATYQRARTGGVNRLLGTSSGSGGSGTPRQFGGWSSPSAYGGWSTPLGPSSGSYGGYGDSGSSFGLWGPSPYGGYAGGTGFGGFGGYNPYGGYSNFSASRSDTETFALGVDWHPSQKLSVNLNFDRQRYDSAYYAAANASQNWSGGLMLTPWDKVSLNAQYSLQRLKYLDQSGGSDSNLLFAGLRLGPFGRLSFHFDFQDLDSASGFASGTGLGFGSVYSGSDWGTWGGSLGGIGGTLPPSGSGWGGGLGSTLLGQRSLSRNRAFTTSLQYQLSPRNQLFLRWQRNTNRADGPYGNFLRTTLSLGFNYALTRSLNLRTSIDRINYRDPNDPSKNYLSTMLGAELGMSF